jgi:ABC-type multidrug transport system fused ATPase/permease subunit
VNCYNKGRKRIQRAKLCLAQASSGAQQALAQIRTVAAYGGEGRSLASYGDALTVPTAISVRQALYTGLALGSVNTILYWTYAAAFMYGAWRVSSGHYTGELELPAATLLLARPSSHKCTPAQLHGTWS